MEVGRALENETKNRWVHFQNKETSGGESNVNNVISNARAFGLMQADTLGRNDFRFERIKRLTPLYLERLHIIYDHQALREFFNNAPKREVEPRTYRKEELDRPILREFDPNQPSLIADFIMRGKVSTGPAGSGSKKISGLLLDICQIRPTNDQGLLFRRAMRELDDDMDVVFTIAGAPLRIIDDAIQRESKRFKLLPIDPNIVAKLNKEYSLGLVRTTFADKYPEGQKTTTIGSWAFLISSIDVPSNVSLRLLDALNDVKHKMGPWYQIGQDRQYQLDEFDFYNSYLQQHRRETYVLFHNMMIFLGSVALSATAILAFLSWMVSEYKRVNFFRDLTSVYDDHLPSNINLAPNKSGLQHPIIHDRAKQEIIINKIVDGTKRLLEIREEMRSAYSQGKIVLSHYEHLDVATSKLRGICQDNLAVRLAEYLEKGGKLTADRIRVYRTAGYLKEADYDRLVSHRRVTPKGKSKGERVTPKGKSKGERENE